MAKSSSPPSPRGVTSFRSICQKLHTTTAFLASSLSGQKRRATAHLRQRRSRSPIPAHSHVVQQRGCTVYDEAKVYRPFIDNRLSSLVSLVSHLSCLLSLVFHLVLSHLSTLVSKQKSTDYSLTIVNHQSSIVSRLSSLVNRLLILHTREFYGIRATCGKAARMCNGSRC